MLQLPRWWWSVVVVSPGHHLLGHDGLVIRPLVLVVVGLPHRHLLTCHVISLELDMKFHNQGDGTLSRCEIRTGRFGWYRFLKLPIPYDLCVSVPISRQLSRVGAFSVIVKLCLIFGNLRGALTIWQIFQFSTRRSTRYS